MYLQRKEFNEGLIFLEEYQIDDIPEFKYIRMEFEQTKLEEINTLLKEVEKIEIGISTCDFFCLVLSNHSINSNWVDREYRIALNRQLSTGTPPILPILLEAVKLPVFLGDIKFADFSLSYNIGLLELLKAVRERFSILSN